MEVEYAVTDSVLPDVPVLEIIVMVCNYSVICLPLFIWYHNYIS